MTFPRHASRSVHEALATRVETGLATLGWTVVDEVPFGGDPVAIKRVRPFVGDRLDNTVSSPSITISLGDENAVIAEELGGSIANQEYPFFLDVFMETNAEATALSCDVRDLLEGRIAGFGRFLSMVDMITGQELPDWALELTDIERLSPEHTFPLEWCSVHVTVSAHFSEVIP